MSEETAAVEFGLKETLEALDAGELILSKAVLIGKDGKVNGGDIKHVIDLAKSSETIFAGVKDADQIDDELKNLDQEKLMQLAVKAISIVKTIKEALKK